MRWLVHGKLSPAVAVALRKHEHTAQGPDEVEIPADTPPAEILDAANRRQLDIITADGSLVSEAIELGTSFSRSIVFVQASGGDAEEAEAVDRLFERYKRLSPRQLYTVTPSRVKVRQLPRPKQARKL